TCNGCGKFGHFIGSCPLIEELITAGKCCQNQEGKIVLPGGGYPPHSIPGNSLGEQIQEWHHRNPGQTVQVPTYPMIRGVSQTSNAFKLSMDDCIAVLKRELLTLHAKKPVFDGIQVPHAPYLTKPKKAPSPSQPTQPIHPFVNVPEALYAPPVHCNFAAPAEKEKIMREKEPAYHTIAPIQNAKIIDDIYSRSMKAPLVTLSSEELLSISVEMRQKMHDAVTPKHVT
ncbi:hypothetical protein L208DRAFT_996629, partial [Tricholoma matsutake]